MIKKYKKFSFLTTKFFNEKGKNYSYLFIKILSPLREDLNYEYIKNTFYRKNFFAFLLINLFIFNKNILIYIKQLIENIIDEFLNISFSKENQILNNQNSSICFLSHCDTLKQIKNPIDSYYGINKQDKNIHFIFLNKTKINSKKFNLESSYNSYFININGSLNIFIYCSIKALASSITLFIKWMMNPKEKIKLMAAVDSISVGSITNLIIFRSIKIYIEKLNVRKIIVTWEGHPWERYLAKYCYFNNISLFGYVHAGPFLTQYSAYRYLGDCYEPKLLLAPTIIAKNLIDKYFSKKAHLIGSNKSDLITNKIKNVRDMDKKTKTILVIPMGTFDDLKTLLNISLKVVDLNTLIRIRLHPALQNNKKIENYIKRRIKNKQFTKNIFFSKESIKNDIIFSTHFLYTCSTAALECLAEGLTPIHYNQTSIINSLEGYNLPKKYEAKNIEDIKRILTQKISKRLVKKITKIHEKSFDINFIKNYK